MDNIEKVSDILKRVLNGRSFKAETKDTIVRPIIDWEKIWIELFPEESMFTEVIGIKGGILSIKTLNSAWMMDLKKRKQEIKNKIQQKTGFALLDVRFFR